FLPPRGPDPGSSRRRFPMGQPGSAVPPLPGESYVHVDRVELAVRRRSCRAASPAGRAARRRYGMDMKTSPVATLSDPGLLKTDALIGGEWVPGDERFDVVDPATGRKPPRFANLGYARDKPAHAA